jgi:hypothetical protein
LTEKVKVRIDGEVIAATRRPDDPRGRASQRQVHPGPLLHGRPQRGRRVPAVHGRGSGVARLLPACTTPVQEGLAVNTSSPQLQSYRKIALELLFAERNHVCAVCVSSGHCELQTLAQDHGVTTSATRTTTRARGRHHAPALRAGPQPLRPVLALRAHVRRDRGRARVGHRRPRHQSRLVSELQRPWGEATAAPAAASACRPARRARWPRRAGASRR